MIVKLSKEHWNHVILTEFVDCLVCYKHTRILTHTYKEVHISNMQIPLLSTVSEAKHGTNKCLEMHGNEE